MFGSLLNHYVLQVRLVQQRGDLVCGMDFHVDVREGWDRHWRNIPAAEIMPYGLHGPQLGVCCLCTHLHSTFFIFDSMATVLHSDP